MGQWLRWQARYDAVQLAYKTGTLDERNYQYKNKETIGELLKIRAAIEGIPEQGIENIKQNIGIVFDKEKAFNYFFNPHATLEEATEYSGAAIDTGLTAYGAAKFLQSAVLAGKSGVTSIQQAAVNAAEKTGFKPLAVGGYGASVSGYKDIEKILSYAKDGVKGVGAAAGGSKGTGKAQRIFTSPDPLVGDLANSIESKLPGRINNVNRVVKDASGRIVTDFDIELDNVIIQVKSGGGKGLTSQLERTVTATNKTVIGYGPDIRASVIKGARAKGFDIFTNIDSLIEFLSK